jgi:transposase
MRWMRRRSPRPRHARRCGLRRSRRPTSRRRCRCIEPGWHRANEASKRLEKIPGVGWLTATALVASIGDAKTFKNGRQLAAWLGLVPRQHSSGGKPRLLGISKRGDTYLGTLLIHGARAAIRTVDRDRTATGQWARPVMTRRPKNVAVVAQANKNARIVWALLAHDRDYDRNYAPLKAAA